MKNAINWFEIPVTDLQKSIRLYEAMLNTQLEVNDFGGISHGVFRAEPPGVSGALYVDPKRLPKRGGQGLTIYLDAPDLPHAVARAVEAGAKVVQPVTSIAPHGAIALIEDLDGNVVGLHQEPTK